jgi:hypothetical protein
MAATLFLTVVCTAMGQDLRSVQQQATTPPPDARFELFQSKIAPAWTLKLDRITGNVDQLVSSKSGSLVWAKMRVLPHPKALNAAKPHFEIFAADAPTQAILLFDTESGATWQLISKGDVSVWQPLE